MTDAYKLEKQLKAVKQLQELEWHKKKLEKSIKYARAQPGEHVGYGSYLAYIEKITFRNAFMGYNTGGQDIFDFESQQIEVTEELINALLGAVNKRIAIVENHMKENQ